MSPSIFMPIGGDLILWSFFSPGEYDALPEQAFYMVGPIEEVVEKAARMAEELA